MRQLGDQEEGNVMNKIIPFSFEGTKVRILEEGGKVFFCGKDVATALGYTNTNKALADHCKGVTKRYPLQTAGGVQQVRFITEGDLYRLTASSKLPSAQAFEAKVFDEVLPTIRKTGSYGIPANQLSGPELMAKALICLLYTSPSPRDAHESRMPSSA